VMRVQQLRRVLHGRARLHRRHVGEPSALPRGVAHLAYSTAHQSATTPGTRSAHAAEVGFADSERACRGSVAAVATWLKRCAPVTCADDDFMMT
jgi:hypothetical protein